MAASDLWPAICALLGIEIVSATDSPPPPMPPAGRQALLAAWGIPCRGDQDLAEIHTRLLRSRWYRQLPPVLVAREGKENLSLPLRLAAASMSGSLAWRIEEEGGGVRQGLVNPQDLPLVEEAEVDGRPYLELELVIDTSKLVPGYHQLVVAHPDSAASSLAACPLIITPTGCYASPGLDDRARLWGLACGLAMVRSHRNWGTGDLTDLRELIRWAADNGAATVFLTPSLSRRAAADQSLTPPLPASPAFPDPLLLDPELVADFQENKQIRDQVNDPAFQVRLAQLRDAEGPAIEEVAALKEEIAGELWRHFLENHLNPDSERGHQFRRFQETGGRRLYAYALFLALRTWLVDEAGELSPPAWPAAWSDPDAPEVLEFARNNGQRIEFEQYRQWQLDLQLAEAGRRSLERGLKVGLILSLPAGGAADGFDVWCDPGLYARGAAVLDETRDYSAESGPAMLPQALFERAYEPFIALLRLRMRHAGGLCLAGMERFVRHRLQVPGLPEGTAVLLNPDTEAMFGILALESLRNRCLVIAALRGQPPELAGVLDGYRILVIHPLFFASPSGPECLVPACSPFQALVQTHPFELASLAGCWQGRDLALASELRPALAESRREQAILDRALERARLLVALNREGLLPPATELDPAGVPQLTPALLHATHLFVARSPARLQVVHLADLPLDEESAPAPAGESAPAWRLRLRIGLEALVEDEQARRLFRDLCREREVGVTCAPVLQADRRRTTGADIPRACYRLQFNREMTFRAAADLLPYLRDLGISHCYASPYLKARPGSNHGYDIIDHSALNPEIGSREDYEFFVTALERNSMAQILDIVPNHMGIGSDNDWWLDVLENGQASPYAEYFDINWQSLEEELRERVLLPVLGDRFGAVLEAGQLRLRFVAEQGRLEIGYFEHCFPLAPETYPLVLGHDLERLALRVGPEDEGLLELQSLIAGFAGLPGGSLNEEQRTARARNKEVLKRLLGRLCREHPEIALFVEENVIFHNGEPGRPKSFDALEALLARQFFRLAFWRVASDEINYRRFFDINDLAGIRMERREVFERTHAFVLGLIASGKIDGLRVDHADGLYDPAAYFRRLQEAVGRLDDEKTGNRDRKLPLYVVAEKILADFEELPADWLVHGSSGYDFSRLVTGLFVDQHNETAMTECYHHFIGSRISSRALVRDCKRQVIETAMAGELNVLTDLLHRLAKTNRFTQDFTRNSLRQALTEIVACFPVYRTYRTATAISDSDRRYVELAVARAKSRQLITERSIYDFIGSTILAAPLGQEGEEQLPAINFIMKFQQYTGPVMAKGLEDTAFYINNRLLCQNEVGSDPSAFGVSPAAFHAANLERGRNWPQAMLSTSTHDSKRSEDVRARLSVLSEMPEDWREAAGRWQRLNRSRKTLLGERLAPSANDEYALYQNLLGIWPYPENGGEERSRLLDRFSALMVKMIREAKVETSWLNPDLEYEQALVDFINGLFAEGEPAFGDDFLAFARRVARFGLFNSAGQLLLKLTAPGVPDIYQGNELFHFCLVDPDNRRPVDFARRQLLLAEQRRICANPGPTPDTLLKTLLMHPEDGGLKLFLLWKTLACRRRHPQLFTRGSYFPLYARGGGKEHICAFGRRYGGETLIVAVPRLVVGLLGGQEDQLPLGREVWGETLLPLSGHLMGRRLSQLFTGESLGGGEDVPGLAAAELFARFPYALLLTSS